MMLVPLFDGISWYVTDDKWGDASNSDWDNAANSLLANTIFTAVMKVGMMAMGDAMKPMKKMAVPLSAVWSGANLYLINKAHGTAASDNNSTKIAVALQTGSLLLSAAGMMDMEHDRPPKPEDDKDAYGGYDYYGYGYY